MTNLLIFDIARGTIWGLIWGFAIVWVLRKKGDPEASMAGNIIFSLGIAVLFFITFWYGRGTVD